MPTTFTALSLMRRPRCSSTSILVVLLTLVSYHAAHGQPRPEFITKLDGSRLAVAELNRLVAEAMAEARVTGLQLAVFNDAQPAYVHSYGYRDAS